MFLDNIVTRARVSFLFCVYNPKFESVISSC